MMKRLISGVLVLVALLGAFPINAFAQETAGSNPDSSAAYVTAADGDYKTWSTSDTRWANLTLGTTTNTVKSAGSAVVAFTKMVIQAGLKKESEFTVADCVTLLNSSSKAFSGAQIAWGQASKLITGLTYSNNGSLSLSGSALDAEILKQIQKGYYIILGSDKFHYVTVDREKTISTGKVYIMDCLASTAANADLLLSSTSYTMKYIYYFTAADHLYAVTEQKAATCTQPGYIRYKCSIHGEEKEDTIKPLGHSYQAGEVVQPTYTSGGYTVYTCTRCGDSYHGDLTDQLPAHDNGWAQENGSWYYYADNLVLTGWQKLDGKWYYLDPTSGAMQTGWQKVDGKWYYLNSSMKTGWQKIDGKWYYLNTYMRTGWQKIDGKWYYLNTSMKTGWQKIDGKWYYLNTSMQTGWLELDGVIYYLGNSMTTGWSKIDGAWYYFDDKGAMQTGWVTVNGNKYYLNADGIMQTGWLELDGVSYYLNSAAATGWAKIDGLWYYFDTNGGMLTGWITISGKTYYLKDTGAMMANEWAVSEEGKYYYFGGNGTLVTGTVIIDGTTYHFDATGVCTDF